MSFPDRIVYNFGCLPPMPAGYRVEWWESDEHLHWVYGDEDDPDYEYSVCDVNPFAARRGAIAHAKKHGRT